MKTFKSTREARGFKTEGKAYGPTGVPYPVPKGHPSEVDPKTREPYPERQTAKYKADYAKKNPIKLSGKFSKNEGHMPDKADQMKHKMLTPSDKDKLLKVRQMLDKEKLSPKAQRAKDAQARIDKKFGPGGSYSKGADQVRKVIAKNESVDEGIGPFRRGPKIFQPKPDDSPERTAMIKSVQKSMNQRKARLAKAKKDRQAAWAQGKDFDVTKALGYGPSVKEGTYQVDIEGLPKMFMSSDNPGQLRRDLRKIVRKVDMVNDVKRIQKSDVRKHLQLKLQGKDEEETNEAHSTKDILKMFPKPSKFSDKEVKMAKGIAFDKRYKGGDMDGAVRAQNKIKKGLSDHPAVARANRAANEAVIEYPHAMYHPKTGEKVMAKTPADHNKYDKIGYVHDDPKKEIDERDLSSKQKSELDHLQRIHKHFSNISSNPTRRAEHDRVKKRIHQLGHKPDVISKNEGFFWVIKEDQTHTIATEDMNVVTRHLNKHGIEHEHDKGELYVRRQDHRDVLNHLTDLVKNKKIKSAPPVTAEKKYYKK